MAFAGDVHFEGQLAQLLRSDPDSVLAPIAPVLRSADLAMVNLETAIGERGRREPKQYTFRAPSTAFRALAAAGVGVATMANNHGLDFGPEGVSEALAGAEAHRLPLVGIGNDATRAYAPYVATIKGVRVAVVGATDVLDEELRARWTATDAKGGLASAKERERLLTAVRAARAQADTLVVYLHWGTEGMTCPSAAQQSLAGQLIAAGADVVVGSHTHRLLGAGRMSSGLVAYGLGNFAFYADGGPGSTTGVLLVKVRGREIASYSWSPAVIRGGVPHPLSGPPAERAVAAWTSLRGCTGLAP